jgi:hypothetical protein
MTRWERFLHWLGFETTALAEIAAAPVTSSSDGWETYGTGTRANDRDWAEMEALYADALEAWRKHPQARRIIDTTTDHVLGDGLQPQAPGQMGRFIDQFWTHRQNRMDLRLPSLVDEWSRAGDLFVALFRNSADGMSYVRAIPKSHILKIVTADNDWEMELEYHEKQGPGEPARVWLSPQHPDAATADAVMCHYAINRPVGALWGDGDLAPIIPWLLRYSRMLEDRVQLNWAARVFYWFVKVPKAAVAATHKKYSSNTPSPGAIIVHDADEEWDMKTPNLGGADAANDLQAVRMMVAVGAGQPPHWLADSMDVNLATATAMERAAVRHMKRRQQEVADMVIDLCHVAYSRAYGSTTTRRLPSRDDIVVELPDISRDDNTNLATAGRELADAFNSLATALGTDSPTLREESLRLFFQFIGEGMDEGQIQAIMDELEAAPEPEVPPQLMPPEEPADAPDPAAQEGDDGQR